MCKDYIGKADYILVDAPCSGLGIIRKKPDIKYFEYVFKKLGITDKKEALIIGDSLTSDMKGGNNAGILCCWYNAKGAVNDKGIRIDFEIDDLQKVKEIL